MPHITSTVVIPEDEEEQARLWEAIFGDADKRDLLNILGHNMGYGLVNIQLRSEETARSEIISPLHAYFYCHYNDAKPPTEDGRNTQAVLGVVYEPPTHTVTCDDVNVTHAKKGKGAQLMRNTVEFAEQVGAEKIVLAAVSKGSYVWARCGFMPTPDEWQSVRKDIRLRLNRMTSIPEEDRQMVASLLLSDDPKALWVISDIPKVGKKLLMDLSCGWNGELRLDDAEAMTRFDSYIKDRLKVREQHKEQEARPR